MSSPRPAIVGRSLIGYLAAVCVMSTSLAQIEGRKCVCTSKACKEAGVDTCTTKFSCYTEFILTTGQEIGESTITRGCTENATPLLCETRSWRSRPAEPSTSPWVRVPWPRLKCCDSHDYCNADDDDDDGDDESSTWTREERTTDTTRAVVAAATAADDDDDDAAATSNGAESPPRRDATPTIHPGRKYEESTDRPLLRQRVQALHVAAFVLAVAALISVLASCYVITRFLRSNRYVMGGVN